MESYEMIGYQDGTAPDINADNLNHMDQAIHDNREVCKNMDGKITIINGSRTFHVLRSTTAPYEHSSFDDGFVVTTDDDGSLYILTLNKIVIGSDDSGEDFPVRIEIDASTNTINLVGNVNVNGVPISEL